jgi:hypothetical protein
MNAETFAGTFFEVTRKLDEWKGANPTCRITREGSVVASGENAVMLDDPVWTLTILFEEPTSN